MRALAIVALLAVPQQATHHAETRHVDRYHAALLLRAQVRSLWRAERREERRTGARRSRHARLSWRPGRLQDKAHRLRHRVSYLTRLPSKRKAPRLSHLAFWTCVHDGEGAWNANTGNGYLGGLQMTPGWGGVARPDMLAPAEQIALAERGYAASGYSTAWLEGQWPNTSPPCLGLL